MRRRILAASAALLTVALAGCSDRETPTTPLVLSQQAGRAALSSNPTVDELINALFSGSNLQSALSQWKNIQKDVTSGDRTSLLSHVNNVTSWVFTHLAAGDLLDPDGAGPLNATTGAIKLLGMIYVYAGISPTQLPAVPSGWDAGFILVDPNSTQNQTLVTSFGDAAASVPPGTFTEPVLLAVIRQPDSITVNTPYPRYSRVFDVAIAPQVDFSSFSVHTCPFEAIDPTVNARAVIAHQKSSTEVEYLPPAVTGSLTCPHNVGSAWQEEKNPLMRRALQLASYLKEAVDLVAPKPLYAGHAAIGGGIDALSPIVVVDPLVSTGLSGVTVSSTTYGQSAHVSATLSITAGPASLVGSAVAAQMITAQVDGGATQTAVTDATGAASWDFPALAAGSHTLTIAYAGGASPLNAPRYASTSSTTTFSIAQATLTLTANDAARAYGDANPSFSGSVSGQQFGDVISLSFSTTATAASPVGTYPITPIASAGAGVLSNYAINAVPGTLTVTPAALNVAANDASRAYGDANPPFDGTITGIRNGDAVSASYSTTATAASPVGTYPIVPAVSGSAAVLANYAVSYTNGTLTVGQASLTVTAANAQRTYGDANPSFTGTISGLRNGDAISATYASAATATSPVGQYAIVPTVNGAASVLANYSVSLVNGTLTIGAAQLSATANDAQRAYGQANPAFSGTLTGVRNGDPVTLTFSTSATVASPVGQYPIVPAVSGAASVLANYSVSTVNGTLTVTRASLTVQLVSGTYTYGQNACVVSYSGFAAGDTPASLSGVLQCTVNGQPAPVPSPVGTYVLTPSGLSSGNYAIAFVGGSVTVRYNTTAGHYFTSPIPNSVYNAGRTIPAKFQLFMADGVTPVTTARARVEMTGVSIPDSQAWFVYSASTQTYQLNINTPRNVAVGAHTITAYLDDGSTIQVQVFIQ